MLFETFLQGVLVGISIAAPVGPVGALCIRTTISHGRLAGLAVGLGAAAADALYGIIAASGLSLTASIFAWASQLLRIGGGLFLCWLGGRALLAVEGKVDVPLPGDGAAAMETQSGHLIKRFLFTFGLTLANPLTIISFAAIFASMQLRHLPGKSLQSVCIVSGVFAGSCAWWLLLTLGVGAFRQALKPSATRAIDVGSALVILLFGLLTLSSVYSK